MTQDQSIRYARHTMLPEVGQEGQVKLLKSKMLLLGAGGLGSPSGFYLAAAGVGTLGLIDDDVVDASNLQRQILHTTDRVGMPKVESAQKTLNALNPDVKVVPYKTRLTSENVLDIIKDYDVIVDGVDNFPTRYLLNDAALKLNKPVVHASIYRFEGQVTCFIPDQGPCYRCLYPEPPPPDMAPSCQEAGVLGVLPGVVGVLQATEAIKIALGIGKTLAGRLLMYDALATKFREMKLRRDPSCPTCGVGVDRSKIELIDYEQFCAVPSISLYPGRGLVHAVAAFAALEGGQVVGDLGAQAGAGLDRAPGQVGGDQQAIGEGGARVGQRVIGGRGFLGEHVQGHAAQVAGAQAGQQRRLVDQAPAAGVDQDGVGRQAGQEGGVDQLARWPGSAGSAG